MLIKLSIVLCLWSMRGGETMCICNNEKAGTHCGQKPQMRDCVKDHLYQCNGQKGSEAYHYGPCRHGCAQDEMGDDYCPLEAGHCICLNSCGGKHCGHSILMGDKCWKNHIYQCSGEYGSVAYHFGPCTKGCLISGCSLDSCQL